MTSDAFDELDEPQAAHRAEGGGVDWEDEDLFDFPPPENVATGTGVFDVPTPAVQPSPQPAPRVSELGNAPALDPGSSDEDLFSFGARFTPDEEYSGLDHSASQLPVLGGPSPAAAAAAPATPLAAETQPAPQAAGATHSVAPSPTDSVSATTEPVAEQPPAPLPAQPMSAPSPSTLQHNEPAVAATPAPQAAPSTAAAPAPSPVTDEAELRTERRAFPRELIGDPLPPLPPRRFLVGSLVVLFLAINAALLAAAWHASQTFQSTLDSIRDELTRSVAASTNSPAWRDSGSVVPRPVDVPLDPRAGVETEGPVRDLSVDRAPIPAPVIEPPAQDPTPLEDYHEVELGLAQQEIEGGDYVKARKRLNQILANQDRAPVPSRALERAEFLLAQSYFREARGIEELDQ